MRTLAFASLTFALLSGCAQQQQPLDQYRDAIAVTVDCEDYDPGLYRVEVKVKGPRETDKDEFEILCESQQ